MYMVRADTSARHTVGSKIAVLPVECTCEVPLAEIGPRTGGGGAGKRADPTAGRREPGRGVGVAGPVPQAGDHQDP